MPSVITDPQAYAKAIMERRRLLQMAQSGAPFDTGQMSPFMQGIIGKTDVPPNAGIQLPTVRGLADTLIPQSMRPPVGVSPSDSYPDPRIEAYRNQSQSGGNLDPEQAASDGFRIPNYILPAQVAGGSGTYMSNAPNPVSPAQVAGGSGDYMSRVQSSPDVAASGATEAQDDFFSFFNKPQATDAMAAFGAGMLRGKNFADGLANATEAVNNVSTKYRMRTPEEVSRLMQEAQLKRIATAKAQGQSVEWSRPLYANDTSGRRTLYYPATDANGNPGFFNSNTQQIEPPRTDGTFNALRAEDDPNKYDSKNIAAAKEQYMQDAIDNATASTKYESLLSDFSAAGGGAGFINQNLRNIAEIVGVDMFGVDVSKKQEVETFFRNLELKQAGSQRGLGQLTEAERDIIRQSLPSLKNDPRAFRRIVLALKARADRSSMMFENWSNNPELQAKYRDPRSYFLSWMKSEEGKQYEANLKDQIEGRVSGESQSSGGSTSSGIKWSIE